MKSLKSLFLLFAAVSLLASCSNDFDLEEVFSKSVNEINVSIADADYTEILSTRSSHTVDPSRGFVTTWTTGDTIGIYPMGADQVAYPISSGEGSSTAQFDGGAWSLRVNHQYGAYYPFSKKNYYINESKIPVSFLDQKQVGNDNLKHLSAYDFMAAAAVSPDENGSVNLTLQHLGAFLRLTITTPKAASYSKVVLSSDANIFTTNATVNLRNGVMTPTAKTDRMTLLLNNVTTTDANPVITAYMMLAPISASDISAHPISVTLFASNGVSYVADLSFTSVIAGKSYAKSASVVLNGLDDSMVETQVIMSDYMHIAISGRLVNYTLKPTEKVALLYDDDGDPQVSYYTTGRELDVDNTFYFNLVNGGRLCRFEPNITCYYRIAIVSTNSDVVKYGPVKSFTPPPYEVVPPTYMHDVDLGLSVRWCIGNLGAKNITDVGYYFAWGELEPKTEFTMENYLYYKNGNLADIGDEYYNISGDPRYDPSNKYHNSTTCRMPTPDEWKELYDSCTWYRTTYNGQDVYQIVGPNGNNIILPIQDDPFAPSNYRKRCYYWSSVAWADFHGATTAGALYINTRTYDIFPPFGNLGAIGREDGALIRPVSDYE